MIDLAAVNIRQGQDFGQLPKDVEPDSAAAYLIGGYRHAIAGQLRRDPRPEPDHATEVLWGLIATTLKIG